MDETRSMLGSQVREEKTVYSRKDGSVRVTKRASHIMQQAATATTATTTTTPASCTAECSRLAMPPSTEEGSEFGTTKLLVYPLHGPDAANGGRTPTAGPCVGSAPPVEGV